MNIQRTEADLFLIVVVGVQDSPVRVLNFWDLGCNIFLSIKVYHHSKPVVSKFLLPFEVIDLRLHKPLPSGWLPSLPTAPRQIPAEQGQNLPHHIPSRKGLDLDSTVPS